MRKLTPEDLLHFNIKIGDSFIKEEERSIARNALELAIQWATIASEDNTNSPKTRSQALKECKKYISENIKRQKYGNVFVSILISLALKLIINYVANLIIERLFAND